MPEPEVKPKILFLTYDGLMSPLGRSQILAYLKRISQHFAITLVTFEKSEDFCQTDRMAVMSNTCRDLGICWIPRRGHGSPKALRSLVAESLLVWEAARHGFCGGADLVHGRSFMGALAGCLVGMLTRVPYVFDTRALWVDEMVVLGFVRDGSWAHRLIQQIDRLLVARAESLVVLTNTGVKHIQSLYPSVEADRFVVIPTCVELERFAVRAASPSQFTVGWLGLIMPAYYEHEWLFRLYRETVSVVPDARLKIVTRENRCLVLDAAKSCGVDLSRVGVLGVAPQQVPTEIVDMSFGVVFMSQNSSKVASAPTRMAEFLASGIPVMVSRSGDMAEIVETGRVGVVVNGGCGDALAVAVREMIELLKDPELPARCRSVAENVFSAEWGAVRFRRLYDHILAKRAPRRSVFSYLGLPFME